MNNLSNSQLILYACTPAHLPTCTCADAAASPECYKQFMAILCGYIVEKQREVQGEELPFDLVFVSHYSTSQMQIYMPRQ